MNLFINFILNKDHIIFISNYYNYYYTYAQVKKDHLIIIIIMVISNDYDKMMVMISGQKLYQWKVC